MLATAKSSSRYGVLAAALLFSTGGAAIKACSFSGWQVAGLRSGIAALALWLLVPGSRRGWTWQTLLVGAFYAATMILFVTANKLTTSANAIFLQSTAPLYLLILGPLFLKESVRRADILAMAAVGAGVALLLSGSETTVVTAPNPYLGNFVAAGAGLMWALTLAGLRWTAKTGGPHAGEATAVAGNVIAFAACLPMAFPLTGGSVTDWSAVVYLGIFQVALAYVFLTRSLRHVPGLEASTLLLAEPVFNPVWSWLIHGEHPSPAALSGGVLILASAVFLSGFRARTQA